jgi:hypothetical protein
MTLFYLNSKMNILWPTSRAFCYRIKLYSVTRPYKERNGYVKNEMLKIRYYYLTNIAPGIKPKYLGILKMAKNMWIFGNLQYLALLTDQIFSLNTGVKTQIS